MSDDRSTFEVTRARLEDIVAQVRRKDVSLEQSLDLLEEAVRLVNQCNDLIDQTSLRQVQADEAELAAGEAGAIGESAARATGEDGETVALETAQLIATDEDGDAEAEFFLVEEPEAFEDDERE